jgi:tRNA U34 5-methylaminomethyl-2-thiouridine-forming methyltransferase MnmC
MIEIISTKDGSHTLRNTELNETYHSLHGAVQESLHVFVREGFEFKLKENQSQISILEVGFGTGLNALLTLKQCISQSVNVFYSAIESSPLDEHMWSTLNYAGDPVSRHWYEQLHLAAWNCEVKLHQNFHIFKMHTTLQQAPLRATYDLVYFDAFAPEKQPEMWTREVLGKVESAMKPLGVLVTYCAKGQVKRDLKSLGLVVETLPGPPGKREMIRAFKP